MSRAFLVGLMLALGVVLAALIAAAVVDANQTGQVAVSTVSLAGATLACLVVLVGIFAAQPRGAAAVHTPHCANCGARMFATLRSLDRREMLTCFSCGLEWALPPNPARGERARGSFEPAPTPTSSE